MKKIKKYFRFAIIYFSVISYLRYLKLLMNNPTLRKVAP